MAVTDDYTGTGDRLSSVAVYLHFTMVLRVPSRTSADTSTRMVMVKASSVKAKRYCSPSGEVPCHSPWS